MYQRKREKGLWIARLLIGLVLFLNVQCAIAFLIAPQDYARGFEIEGVGGRVMVSGLGLLFLMRNVPYAAALWRPRQHLLSLVEAITMQSIGLCGEAILLSTVPVGHTALRLAAKRFIIFDSSGLFLLLLAFALVRGKFKHVP